MKKFFFYFLLAIFVGACKPPEARHPVSQKSGSFIDESIARNKKIVAAEELQIKEIIELDTANQYHTSSYGFWYYYVEKDTTATQTPKIGDVVEFDYRMESLKGQTIYSKEELSPKTYRIDKEKLFAGLRQGLKLMNEGETVVFLFPSHKVFGFYGDNNRIGRNVPVKTTVTLKKIHSEEPITNHKINKK